MFHVRLFRHAAGTEPAAGVTKPLPARNDLLRAQDESLYSKDGMYRD